jgi:uncharacterized membrane protein (UPF0127 family)
VEVRGNKTIKQNKKAMEVIGDLVRKWKLRVGQRVSWREDKSK